MTNTKAIKDKCLICILSESVIIENCGCKLCLECYRINKMTNEKFQCLNCKNIINQNSIKEYKFENNNKLPNCIIKENPFNFSNFKNSKTKTSNFVKNNKNVSNIPIKSIFSKKRNTNEIDFDFKENSNFLNFPYSIISKLDNSPKKELKLNYYNL